MFGFPSGDQATGGGITHDDVMRENRYEPWVALGIDEIAYWKRRYLEQSALAQKREEALRECYACIEDGKPGDALDVIARVLEKENQNERPA